MPIEVKQAPYNKHRRVVHAPWIQNKPHCETCGKPTQYQCGVCGQCVTEANR